VRSNQCLVILLVMFGLVSLACVRNVLLPGMSDDEKVKGTAFAIATQAAQNPPRKPGEVAPTPTTDSPHKLPTPRTEPEKYIAKAGDTYGMIANDHGIPLQDLLDENDILDPNLLSVGQELGIPVARPAGTAPGFKIIPDSELVYGPTTTSFSTGKFMEGRQGYLSTYTEEVDGVQMAGVEIVNRIAREYSVNPRLLLALLEHMSGWVTNPRPASDQIAYPLNYDKESNCKGLYCQLKFAANNLNMGFYLWQADALGQFILVDGTTISANPNVNAGTVGVQYFFSKVLGKDAWEKAITEHGFITGYQFLFQNPFDSAFEPLLPRNLHQPLMALPFEPGVNWSFTSGPHAAWGTGSAWGALDFAPPGDMNGCNSSDDWVTAVANGRIVRSGNGAVVLDLDGDGSEQTGWTVLFMHIESRDRIARGTVVKIGDPIGHPSCEGGVSTGTHLHIARRYNGTWIAADRSIPFIMDGWVSSGQGTEYDGELTRKDRNIKAENGRSEENQISR
jgi:LasA protease